MALQKCGLNLNSERRELQPHGTLEFPCAGYSSTLREDVKEDIPWHWHEEIEIIFVKMGKLEVYTPENTCLLGEGQGVFINSNRLHMAKPIKKCEIHSLVFHKTLIAGVETSIYENKYIQPIMNNLSLSSIILEGKYDWQVKALGHIKEAFESMLLGECGYEFWVRHHLSYVWYLVYRQFQGRLEVRSIKENSDTMRLKNMLYFIHQHYMEDIALSQIAQQVSISERECLRCFQRTIKISPMQYLLKYRITQAASFLGDTHFSILEIAQKCGFESSSHFSQTFKKYYNNTPTQYRKLSK